jgi:predicted GTPase
MVKLAEDRFTLAVLGQFKRGKSSLMNAIIGREFLPTGVLPLTSAITVLRYGPAERLLVYHINSTFPEELPVAVLADYVTEERNPNNQKKVRTVRVEMPVPFLRYGIEFVDTPGVGSAIAANTATTYGFLPECDAVLFVTAADSPMTSLELAFLQEIGQYVDKIFFVVNKIDLMAEEERNQVLGYVRETIRKHTGQNDVKLFAVSSRQGLAARTSGDAVLYERSGLKALEDALGSFLSVEKSATFLSAVAQKALRIMDTEMTPDVMSEAALEARATALKKEKTRTVQIDPHMAARAIGGTRLKLVAIYKGISGGELPGDTGMESPSFTQADTAGEKVVIEGGQASVIPGDDKEQAAMEADLRVKSCPVCGHMSEQAYDFLVHWQYRISAEERAQEAFAAELGFCPLHTWQLLSISSPYGASVGYARLAERVAYRLREDKNALTGDAIGRMVNDSRSCRVCALLRLSEGAYIRQLAGMIGEPDGRSLYRRSEGSCLRHLGMLVDAVSSAEIRDFLLSHAARRFEEDAEDMRGYALKRDALRRSLQNTNEEDAYRRTIIRIVGDRSVCVPWAEDGEI